MYKFIRNPITDMNIHGGNPVKHVSEIKGIYALDMDKT